MGQRGREGGGNEKIPKMTLAVTFEMTKNKHSSSRSSSAKETHTQAQTHRHTHIHSHTHREKKSVADTGVKEKW